MAAATQQRGSSVPEAAFGHLWAASHLQPLGSKRAALLSVHHDEPGLDVGLLVMNSSGINISHSDRSSPSCTEQPCILLFSLIWTLPG